MILKRNEALDAIIFSLKHYSEQWDINDLTATHKGSGICIWKANGILSVSFHKCTGFRIPILWKIVLWRAIQECAATQIINGINTPQK